MTAPISSTGVSLQNQNLSVIRAYIKQLSQQVTATGLDEKTTQTLQKALHAVDTLAASKSVKDLTAASKQLTATLDYLGNIDPEFIADQLEELTSHKGKKDKISTQITAIHQAVAVYFQNASSIPTQNSSSFEQGGSKPKVIEALKKINPELLSEELIDDAEEGQLGPITGVAIALEQYFHLNSSSGSSSISSSSTIGSAMLAVVGSFSTDELEELIKAILQNGFRDINEVIGLLALIGEHGPGIDPELLELLSQKIIDFIETEASKATSIVQFMAFLDELAAFMSTDVGMDMFEGLDLEGTLSNMMQSQGDGQSNSSSINAMANTLGIQNIAEVSETTTTGENGDPIAPPVDPTQIMEQGSFKLDHRVNALDKSELSQSDTNTVSPLSRVEKSMESFLNHKKSEFTIQTLSMFENYIEKHLDKKMNDFDLEDIDLNMFDSSPTGIDATGNTESSSFGFA